jgi:hypothetical protein
MTRLTTSKIQSRVVNHLFVADKTNRSVLIVKREALMRSVSSSHLLGKGEIY